MTITHLPSNIPLLQPITHLENKCSSVTLSLRFSKTSGLSGFMQRQLVSRIVAVASCVFSFLLLLPKLGIGLWEFSVGTARSLKARKLDPFIFSRVRTNTYFSSLIFSLGAVIRLPIILIRPDILNQPKTIQNPPKPTKPPKIAIPDDLQIDHQMIARTHLTTMTEEERDANWGLKDFFGSIRFINLDRSKARCAAITQQLESIGLCPEDYTRHAACDGRTSLPKECYDRVDSNYKHISTKTPEGQAKLDHQHQGQAGCYMSHYTLIKDIAQKYDAATAKLAELKKDPTATPAQLAETKAAVQKYSSVLILEDDATFGTIASQDITIPDGKNRFFSDKLTTRGIGTLFRNAMRDLPKDWDMLYFIALSYSTPKPTHSPNLLKLTQGVTTTAYAVNAPMYPYLLQQLSKIEQPNTLFKPVDDELCQLHQDNECYVITPPLVAQPGEDSIIGNVMQSDPRKKYWQSI